MRFDRHLPDPQVLKLIGLLTLKVNVAVLELFQKMLVRQEQLRGPRVGPGDNWGPIDQTGVLAQYRFGTLPLQPGSRSVQSSEVESAHYSNKQTRRRPAKRTFRRNRHSQKRGEYGATW